MENPINSKIMKIEQTVKEYKLSEEVTLSDGTTKEVSIIVTVNKKSVSMSPSTYTKEFMFTTVKMDADKMLLWQTTTKLMYAATSTIESLIDEKKEDEPISTEA
jgi:hypothetical protein